MVVFVEGDKPKKPEKGPWIKDEDQQQIQPTYDSRPGNQALATVVGSKNSQYCTIPAPNE